MAIRCQKQHGHGDDTNKPTSACSRLGCITILSFLKYSADGDARCEHLQVIHFAEISGFGNAIGGIAELSAGVLERISPSCP